MGPRFPAARGVVRLDIDLEELPDIFDILVGKNTCAQGGSKSMLVRMMEMATSPRRSSVPSASCTVPAGLRAIGMALSVVLRCRCLSAHAGKVLHGLDSATRCSHEPSPQHAGMYSGACSV